jgi:hypothetical protein
MLTWDGSRITNWLSSGVRSNRLGEFQISNVTPGKYAAFASEAYDSNQLVSYYSEPILCEVSGSDVHGIEIKTRNGGSISGQVVIEGTNDPAMLAKSTKLMPFIYHIPGSTGQLTTPFGKQVKTNPDGSFIFQGVPPGKIRFDLMTPPGLEGITLIRIERNSVPQPRDGIEIASGEHLSNIHLVAAIGTLSLQGEIKIVGGKLPQDILLYVNTTRVDNRGDNIRDYQVDTRNQFLIEHLAPGEYELRLRINGVLPSIQNVSSHVVRRISEVRQKVLVSGNNQQLVTLTVDLGQRENNQ